MSMIIPKAAELALLDLMKSGLSTFTVRLYKTPITLDANTVIGSFTEANFGGYASFSTAWTWGASVLDGTNRAQTTAGFNAVFTHSALAGTNTIYGYYITNSGNTVLYWCEVFPAGPYVMANNGDVITLTPRMTLLSQF